MQFKVKHKLDAPFSMRKIEIRRVKTNYYLLPISRPFCKIPCEYFGGCPNKSREFIRTSRLCDSENRRGYTDPIHFGKAILGHHGCRIDVKSGILTFDVGDVHVEFNLPRAAKFPCIFDECNKIDVVNSLIRETASNINSNDPFEHLMLNNNTTEDENSIVAECAQLLEASPPTLPSLTKVQLLQDESKPFFDEAKAPEVELKSLPSSLKYEFLGPKSTYVVIVNANLNATQVDSLLRVVRKHRKAIGYTLGDLKRIHPMHQILMEDDHKSSIEHQRRLKPSIQEVVKRKF